MAGNNGSMNINIPLDQTDEIRCNKCDGTFFASSLYIRKASGFLTGTGKPSYIPIPVFSCINCGHVNKEFMPREVREEE